MGVSTRVLHALTEGVLTIDEIAGRIAVQRRSVVESIHVLWHRGLVVRQTEGIPAGSRVAHYRLTAAGVEWAQSGREIASGQAPKPRTRTCGLRERAWWHLRAHQYATLRELMTTHATGHERDAETNLLKYLSALEKAGILARAGRLPAKQSRGRVLWRLVLDLGPKAPVWREKSRQIYDPNGCAVLSIDRAESGETGEAGEGEAA